jgi:hypothetical protein
VGEMLLTVTLEQVSRFRYCNYLHDVEVPTSNLVVGTRKFLLEKFKGDAKAWDNYSKLLETEPNGDKVYRNLCMILPRITVIAVDLPCKLSFIKKSTYHGKEISLPGHNSIAGSIDLLCLYDKNTRPIALKIQPISMPKELLYKDFNLMVYYEFILNRFSESCLVGWLPLTDKIQYGEIEFRSVRDIVNNICESIEKKKFYPPHLDRCFNCDGEHNCNWGGE